MSSFVVFIIVMINNGTRRLNSKRVVRGGCWINNARNLRSANRNANTPDNRNHNIGFRLAGALLSVFYKEIKRGGSINQSSFLLGGTHVFYLQNQGSLRASKHTVESLQLSRFFMRAR